MESEDLNQRLSMIVTNWSLLAQAHGGQTDKAERAKRRLLKRYGRAVHRYLLSLLGDPHAAEDLTQEFALRFVRGDFRRADPQHGRFRSYVKTALFHLVNQYRRTQRLQPRPLSPDSPELAELIAAPAEDADAEFAERWRKHLLRRAGKRLSKVDPVQFSVLRFRVDHPNMRSQQMATHLTQQLGRPFTASNVRQTLHRAREKFADLLIEEIAQSLKHPTPDEVERELRELNLLTYCLPVLNRRTAKTVRRKGP